MERTKKKYLIEFSTSLEEANSIIEEEGFVTVREKIAYLKGMFGVDLIGRHDCKRVSKKDSEEMDYYALLSAIINGKWEA